MLKWTVHKTANGGASSRSVGPCYSIRRAAAKLSKHRPRRSSSLNNKENEEVSTHTHTVGSAASLGSQEGPAQRWWEAINGIRWDYE